MFAQECQFATRKAFKPRLFIFSFRSWGRKWGLDRDRDFVGSRKGSIAFFGPTSLTKDSVLYVAYNDDGRNVSLSPPFMSSRRAAKSDTGRGKFEYTITRDNSVTKVDLYPGFKQTYSINYVYGFSHKGFSFFVGVQRVSVNREAYETRLARVCQNDSTYFSYTEIALWCFHSNGERYDIATSAFLGKIGSAKFNELDIDGNHDDVLYVTFAQSIDGKSSLLNQNKGSVMW